MSTSQLNELKSAQIELRQALHALDAICGRIPPRDATTSEIDVVLARLDAAAERLRAARDAGEHHAW
jgi:hypothetical protein